MSRIRKVRDMNTGMSYYIDIETGDPVDDHQKGGGIMNSLISTAKKSLTSKTTKDLAKKAGKKGVQHVAHKTGNIIKNRLNKATKKETEKLKKYTESENKGDMIVSLLQSHPENKKFQPERTKNTEEQLRNDILSLEFDKLTNM